jgi:hypothetical protein
MEKMTKRYFLITHRRKEKKNISKVRAQKKRKENREEEKLFMENSSLKDSRNSAHVTLDTKISKKNFILLLFHICVSLFIWKTLFLSLFSLHFSQGLLSFEHEKFKIQKIFSLSQHFLKN